MTGPIDNDNLLSNGVMITQNTIMKRFRHLVRWLAPGIRVKRWLFVLILGNIIIALGFTFALLKVSSETFILDIDNINNINGWAIIGLIIIGMMSSALGYIKLSRNLLAPFRRHQRGRVIDVVYEHNKRQKGFRVVAIGGGTGLPSVLRGLKTETNNITAIVTVADDGGSSGRLRRDLGVLPPGDLRNNITALADDDSLLTRLFQYRFSTGELSGHSFGNLFIATLATVADGNSGKNSLAEALIETERILNIQGRVLPATLDDVYLEATVRLKGSSRSVKIRGESKIGEIDGIIEAISLQPSEAVAYSESVRAILEADLIIIGPGSLYTSILPNLLVKDIANALRASSAYKIYVCNVATQPVETENYTVAEHVIALEKHIGRGVVQVILANNTYPTENAGDNTHYVQPVPSNHEILQRYDVRYTDLTDPERPWRHSPQKLANAILALRDEEKTGVTTRQVITSNG